MQIYILLALIISFLWGLQPIVHKYLMQKFNAITLMLISSIVYCSMVILVSIARNKEIIDDINKITPKDASIIVILAAFTVFLTNMMYYYILKNHESSIVSALIYSSPVFTLILAYLFLKERLDIFGVSGILSIVIGVVLIAHNNQSSRNLIIT